MALDFSEAATPSAGSRPRPSVSGTGFALLADFWAIGALAGAICWAKGIEARGLSLEALAARLDPARGG